MSVVTSVHLDFSRCNSILDEIDNEIFEISKAMKGPHDNRLLMQRCTRQKARVLYQVDCLYKLPEMTQKISGTLLIALKISQFASKVNEFARFQRDLTSKDAAKNVKNFDEMRPEISNKINSIIFKDDKSFYLYSPEDEPQ